MYYFVGGLIIKYKIFILILLILVITSLGTVFANDSNKTSIHQDLKLDESNLVESSDEKSNLEFKNDFGDNKLSKVFANDSNKISIHQDLKLDESNLVESSDEKSNLEFKNDFGDNKLSKQNHSVLSDGNRNDLAKLFYNAAQNSIIKLNQNYKITGSAISVSKPLTIDGNGHTINMDGGNCYFTITAANIVFKNIKFINSGIYVFNVENNPSSTFKVINCIFQSNKRGISAYSGITVINSSFISNIDSGIAIYTSGSVIKNTNIINCTFVNNTSNKGGAINVGDAGSCTVVNSSFINNSVTGSGSGGAINVGAAGSCTVINSSFVGNGAYYGGCIHFSPAQANQKGYCNVYDSIFINNSAQAGPCIRSWSSESAYIYLNVKNCLFMDNIGFNHEGVIQSYEQGHTNIFNSTFINCSSTQEMIYVRYEGLNISECNFVNISCKYLIYIANNPVGSSTTYIGNCNFSGNNVRNYIVYCTASRKITFKDCIFDDGIQINVLNNDDNCYLNISLFGHYKQQVYSDGTYEGYEDIAIKNLNNQNLKIYIYDENNVLVKSQNLVTDKNGKTIYNYLTLDKGNYTYKVEHNTYKTLYSKGNFTYDGLKDPGIIVNYSNIVYGNNFIANVTLNSDVRGNISLIIGGKRYNITINDENAGNVIFYIPNLAASNYTVNVEYPGDGETFRRFSTSFNITVSKAIGEVIILVDNVIYENITVTTISAFIPDRATGKINLTFNNNTYLLSSGDVLTFNDLNTTIYSVFASYDGDYNFTASNSSTWFKVNKNPNMKINIDDEVISISLDKHATGYILFDVDNNGYNWIKISNSTINIELPKNLSPGNHTLTVTYLGDNNYVAITKNMTFIVPKYTPELNIIVSNITFGEVESVLIILPDGATGNVTVTLLNKSEIIQITNKVLIHQFYDLTSGNYTVLITYNGDSKYTNTSISAKFKVKPIVIVNPISNSSNINISTPDGVSGNITIRVNGTNITSTIANNSATFNLSNLTPGIHNGTVSYIDEDGLPVEYNITVTIPKWDSNISLSDDEYKVLMPINIDVTTNFKNGIINYYLDGVKQDSLIITNNNGIINIPSLTAGNHTIMLIWFGDKYYNNLTISKTIVVNKINSTVNVTADTIQTGNRVTINVAASGNGSATIVIYNSTDIITTYTLLINNGNGSSIIPHIFTQIGSYNVNVTYDGDDVYLDSFNSTTFDVEASYGYDFKIITTDALVGQDAIVNVTLPGNANENVILTLHNQTNLTIKAVNGVAVFYIKNLAYGNYTFNVTYAGDNNYQKATKIAKLSIFKHIPLINLTTDTNFNATGDIIGSTTINGEVNLIISLPNDLSGKLAIYLNDNLVEEDLPITTSNIVTELKDYFKSGINTVKVIYSGDDKYYNSTIINYIFASSSTTYLNVTTDKKHYIVGENVKLNISTNAEGNLSIYLNSELIETIQINGNTIYTINNVGAIDKTIMVIFHPNEHFTGVFNTTSFDVVKKNTTLIVDVSGNSASLPVTVVVTVDNNVTGWVSAYVNGTTPQHARGLINNNQVIFTFYGLEIGKHNVLITYEGDNNYNNKTISKEFVIDKSLYYAVDVDVKDIYIGDDAYVLVKLPEGAEGKITIIFEGQNYTGILNNASVNITIPANVITNPGKYNIIVSYNGSESFNATSVVASFNVFKISNYNFNVSVSDIKFGDLEIINIALPNDVNNTQIKVLINNIHYNIMVIDGKAKLELNNLTVGSKNVKIIFNGNNKYNPSNITDKFIVLPKDVELIINVIPGLNNATVNVIANPNINETVQIYVAGKNKSIKLINGIGNVTFTDLVAGNYTALVIFDATENYTASTNKTNFQIDKQNFNITINVLNKVVYVGGTNAITISYPSVDSTELNILVNNKQVPMIITKNGNNDVAFISLSDLTEGKYTISVKYIGDKYNPTNASASFNVLKVNVNQSAMGNGSVLNITVPDNIKGNVTVNVNGTNFTGEIINGSAMVNLTNVTPGIHNITISYIDENGTVVETNITIIIPKWKSSVNFTVSNININNKENIVIEVTKGATGSVLIDVNGTIYYKELIDSKTTLVLDNLKEGLYPVTVIYLGDEKYDNATSLKSFTVSKISIDASSSGNSSVLNITVPDNVKGNVTVSINGTNFTGKIVNGSAIVNLSNLTPGIHNITISYTDENGTQISTNITITVPKWNSEITLNVLGDLTVVSQNKVNITTNFKNGNLDVYIDGVKQNTLEIINNNGIINLKNLSGGNHTVMLIWAGNDHYNNSTVVKTFIISKLNSQVSVNASDIETGNMVTVEVSASGNGSATITIFNSTNVIGTYNLVITNSKGMILVPYKFNSTGSFNINVTYNGDEIYLPNVNSTTFNVDAAYDYEFKVITNDALVGQGSVVNVTLPVNANGNVVLTLPNGTNLTVKAVNGVAVFDINGLAYGNYTIDVTYLGDNNYKKATKQGKLSIFKHNPNVNLTSNIKFNVTDNIIGSTTIDGNVNLTIHLPNGSQGTLTVYLNDDVLKQDWLVNSSEMTIELKDFFTYGVNSVKVIYSGDDKYYDETVVNYIFASASETNLNVTVNQKSYIVGSDVKLNISTNAWGEVSIYVNSQYMDTIFINGNEIYTLTNVTAGEKSIMLIFHPNDEFASVFNTTSFDVVKKNTSTEIEVIGNSASLPVIVVVSVEDNVTGWVSAYVNGTTPQHARGYIVNNQVSFTFFGLEVGLHNVTIFYEGDDNYNDLINSKTFTIDKALYYQVNVTVEDIYVGDDAYVIVKLPDGATGLINITLKGKNFTGILENATAKITIPSSILNNPGKYSIIVSYNGSESFNATSVVASFNVLQVSNYNINITSTNIFFNGLEIIDVTLPKDINNTQIRLLINNDTYYLTVIEGKTKLELNNLTVGFKEIKVIFDGNTKYVASNATDKFVVLPANIVLNVNVSVGISNATVNVIANHKINENVEIFVGGKNKTVKLVDGIANVTFTDLVAGNYTALVLFEATENYTAASNKTDFYIKKQYFNITINVLKDVLYVGSNNTIIINYTQVPSTDLEITVNGKQVPMIITNNGNNNIAVINLDNMVDGKYTVLAKYLGNKYLPTSVSANFTVLKININPASDGNSSVLNITVPENTTGNVTVKINGTNYTGEIVNGSAIVNLTNVTPGTHNITISYTDANGTEIETNITINVPKWKSGVELSVTNIESNENEIIIIEVTKGATGAVLINVNGTIYYKDLNNSKTTLVLENLKVGTYSVTVIYLGDKYYENSTNVGEFKVIGEIDIKPSSSTNSSNLNITVPEGITGNITVIINGTNYTGEIINGSAIINLTNVTPGTHNITVVYVDANGTVVEKNVTITIPKWISNTSVNVTNIEIFDKETIIVEVTKGATGDVLIKVGDKTYYKNLTDSKAILVLENLKAGSYNVRVTYLGDEYYNSSAAESYFIVSSGAGPTPISGLDITVTPGKGDATVKINAPDDFNGDINVIIDNIIYPITVTNGVGSKVVPLNPGKHELVGAYTINNPKYGDTFNPQNIAFNVENIDPETNYIIKNNKNMKVFYKEGKKFEVRIVDKNGKPLSKKLVIFKVKGSTFKAVSDNKGYASIPINWKPGKYTIKTTCEDKSVTNKINVKNVIHAPKNVKVKKSKKNTKFKIALWGLKAKIVKKPAFKYNGKTKIPIKLGKDLAGKKVSVKFKGEYFTTKVDSNGKGVLKISKKVARDLKLKKGKKYKARVVYKDMIIYKKQPVNVKIDGKTYKVKTNKKGVSIFKITKKMAKKLKPGKKYPYYVEFGENIAKKNLVIKK